ncbi:MAG: hypothetical protein R3F48_09275 [Candidatus Zixiibacteriota bacterium]
MSQAVRFGEFSFLYRQVLRQMLRIALWLPLLLQGLLTIGLAFAHENMFSTVFGPILEGWVKFLYTPEAARAFFFYPDHYLILPAIFSASTRVFSFICEAFFFAVFSDLLIALYRGEKPIIGQAFSHAFKSYIKLTVSWAVLLLVLYFVSTYFYSFLENVLGFSLHTAPRRQFLALIMLHGVNVLIYMPFIYVIPSIMAGGAAWWPAITRAVRLTIKHPFITLAIVAIPYTIAAVPSLPLSYTRKIISIFNPELVFQLMLVVIVINILANFVLLGAAVKFFMDKNE